MQSSNQHLHRAPTLVSQTHYCVVGDVTVDATAAIAAGVVLQASPGSRIVVEAGVCMAGGVCLQSREGVLTVCTGTNLGANVLVVGHGEIGERSCISPGSTVINPRLEPGAVVPPGSCLDMTVSKVGSSPAGQSQFSGAPAGQSWTSQSQAVSSQAKVGGYTYQSFSASASTYTAVGHAQVGNPSGSAQSNLGGSSPDSEEEFVNTFVDPGPVGPKPIETPDLSGQNGQFVDPTEPRGTSTEKNGLSSAAQSGQGYGVSSGSGNFGSKGAESVNSSALSAPSHDRVYGRDQVNQLMSTLFPHRQASLNQPSTD